MRKPVADFIVGALDDMINCGYCGKANADEATRCFECGTELPRQSPLLLEVPPALPEPELINLAALEAGFSHEDGFHRADWNLIGQWIESHVASLNAEEAWNEAALLWVTKLRDDVGGNYSVLQSRQAILLSDQPLKNGRWLLDYTGRAVLTIREHLGEAAWVGAIGKHVLLSFSEQDDYYQYVAFHCSDGEQAASGGMCIHSGYVHIAFPWSDEIQVANMIVHELTHECLAHRPLPRWLNEGVALTLERAIGPSAHAHGKPPLLWDDSAERHFAFWTPDNIQSFWAGTSFFEPGDSNELSYSLAEVLVKLLSERGNAGSFRAFLQAAECGDAGQTAALEILGADLGEIAGTFLGEGTWRPQRKALVACWESAGWGAAEQG